jgi:hypothetical protein
MTGIYEYFKNFCFNASTQDFELNPGHADIRGVLVTNEYSPDYYNDAEYKDIKKFEVKGKGYKKGGQIIGPCTVKKVAYNKWTDVSLVPVWRKLIWYDATFTTAGVAYYWNKSKFSKFLMAHHSFGQDMSVCNGLFTITQDSGGLFVYHSKNELMREKYPAHPYRHKKPELLINSIRHIKPVRRFKYGNEQY